MVIVLCLSRSGAREPYEFNLVSRDTIPSQGCWVQTLNEPEEHRDGRVPSAASRLSGCEQKSYQPRVCSISASDMAATARPFMAPTRSWLTSSNTLGSS